MVEIDSRATLALARIHAGIEAAAPLPLVDVDRAACAARDRSDLDVTVIDARAVGAFGIAAASKPGHAPMIAPIWPHVKPLGLVPAGDGDPSEALDSFSAVDSGARASRGQNAPAAILESGRAFGLAS
jgi:hypothetical protein